MKLTLLAACLYSSALASNAMPVWWPNLIPGVNQPPVIVPPPASIPPPPVPAPFPAPGGPGPFVYTEMIPYSGHVTVTSTNPVVIPHYTRQVRVDRNCDVVLVDLTIPYVGNEDRGTRSRIWLRVNGEIVSDATKFNMSNWELHQIHFKAVVANVQAGSGITIEVMAAVERGTLHIPHYNTGLMEATASPAIAASLNVVGLVA